MRSKRINSPEVHLAKGNRKFNKAQIMFRAFCMKVGKLMADNEEHSATYSIDQITCGQCLENYIAEEEKELLKAKEYLKYAQEAE